MTVERSLNGFRFVEIQHGDTLQRLAARELGDASKWALLVSINDLAPPYVTGDPAAVTSQVRLYGDLIAVPAATPQISADIDPNRVFKVDLDLTDGELRADAGDMLLIAGRANLRQALTNRIETPLGELMFHPSYGCGVHALKGAGNDKTAGILAGQYVKGALLSDSRSQTVSSVMASVSGDRIEVEASIQPVAGAPVDISTEI